MENQNTGATGTHTLSLGEMRVGISFNPGGHEQVNEIKRRAAELIDYVESQRPPKDQEQKFVGHHNEVNRLISLAQTHLEDAAMWAVKAVTK